MEQNRLLESYLRQLRLPTFVQNYQPFAADAAANQLDYTRYLLALAEQEVTKREQNQLQKRLKAARFPVVKELASFDFSAIPALNKPQLLDLAQGEYIQKRETIVLLGNPGLGKTHLAMAACRKGKRVRFWTAAGLVGELLQAQDEHRLHRMIAMTLKLDLVVVDELGFIPFTASGSQALFTFCSELYERLALIVTTNLKFADWVQIFGDERLTYHAHIIELVGESFRFRQRMLEGQKA